MKSIASFSWTIVLSLLLKSTTGTPSPTYNAEDTFRKWFTSDTTLTSGNSWMFAEYLPDYDNDTIFVWGGVTTLHIYEYTISQDTISIYDTLSLNSYAYSKNSFYINDELFWFDTNNNYFQKYNLTSKTHTLLYNYSTILQSHSCMVQDPRQSSHSNVIYFVEAVISDTNTNVTTQAPQAGPFYYIELNGSTTNYSLIDTGYPSTIARNVLNCISFVSDNDIPYLYQSGHGNVDDMQAVWQRINLGNMSLGWENGPTNNLYDLDCLNVVNNVNDSFYQGLVFYQRYLYAIGSSNNSVVGVIDTIDNVGNCSQNNVDFTPSDQSGQGLAQGIKPIVAQDRFYVFGFYDGINYTKTIAYSNDLSLLRSSTFIPTSEPSLIPSSNPTNYPTNSPTNAYEDTLRKWTSSQDIIPINTSVSGSSNNLDNAFMFAQYVPDIDDGDSIFIWGGKNLNSQNIYKYSISTDIIELYDTLPYATYAYSKNSFYINDEIYWLDANNMYFQKYNITNKTYTLLNDYSGEMNRSCMCQDPRSVNDENFENVVYFVDGGSISFYYINMSDSNNTFELIETAYTSFVVAHWRNFPNCIAFLSDDNIPYMYQAGYSFLWKRINLNDVAITDGSATGWTNSPQNMGPDWDCIDGSTFVWNGDLHGLVYYGRKLYSVGSLNTLTNRINNIIGVIDVTDDNGNCSMNTPLFYPSDGFNTRSEYGIRLVIAQNRIFAFGFYDEDANTIGGIAYSNDLSILKMNTPSPTFNPTDNPTTTNPPSLDPTIMPSMPSMAPSNQPTTFAPTASPIDLNDSFISRLGITLESGLYDWNSINSSDKLQSGIINGLKDASIIVRFDLNSRQDFNCYIIQVSGSSEQLRRRIQEDNSTAGGDEVYATYIIFRVIFFEETTMLNWQNDIDLILEILPEYILLNWNISDTVDSSQVISNVTLVFIETETTGESLYTTTEANDDTKDDDKDAIAELNGVYYNVILFVGSIYLCLAIFGQLDAKVFRKNDTFAVWTIFVAALYTFDFISDIMMVLQIWIVENITLNEISQFDSSVVLPLLLCILSIVFIIIPVCASFIQLQKEIKNWVNDVDTRKIVPVWIQQHVKFLYLLCVISGNAFIAVGLCNSNLFGLFLFDLGLNKRQLAVYKNKRIFSIVLLENFPQLIIQLLYSISSETVTYVTISATLFSLTSIILSIMEYCTKQVLLDDEMVCVIKLNVISDQLGNLRSSEFRRLQNTRRAIEHEISKLINAHLKTIELLRPVQLKDGLNLCFYIRSKFDNTQNIIQIIRKESNNGHLAQAFFRVWKQFDGVISEPTIGHIETKLLSSIKDIENNNDNPSNLAAMIAIDSKPTNPNANSNVNKNANKTDTMVKETDIRTDDMLPVDAGNLDGKGKSNSSKNKRNLYLKMQVSESASTGMGKAVAMAQIELEEQMTTQGGGERTHQLEGKQNKEGEAKVDESEFAFELEPVASMKGFVYILDNSKGKSNWDKIGDIKSCTISLYPKSSKSARFASPNGSLTLTTVQIDGSTVVTYIFEFNGSELTSKEDKAWRVVVQQPNGTVATLAVRFLQEKDCKLFENSYKFIMENETHENSNQI